MSLTRGRTKPKMTEAQRHLLTAPIRPGKRKEMLQGSGVSWWTAFAQGARRDAEYQAEADRRCPASITRKQMGPTLTPWAD